jgi:hypothetical protein
MIVEKWRKKPVVVEAVQWTGENFREIKVWSGDVGLVDGVDYVRHVDGSQ